MPSTFWHIMMHSGKKSGEFENSSCLPTNPDFAAVILNQERLKKIKGNGITWHRAR